MERKGISGIFIEHPIATSLLMAGLLFVGIVSYPLLPVAPLPQVDFPTIQVTSSLPGASPETMASSVAQPLERVFSQIPGVTQLTSSSAIGATSITVQFDLNRNIDAAAQDVQSAINAAGGQLPKTLPAPPTYRKINPADSPVMLLAVQSDVLPIIEVDDNADVKIAQQISQMPGVGFVTIGGEQKPSVRVQIDPHKLAAKGLTLEDVRSTIGVATTDSPKGTIDGDTRNFTIYSNDQLTKAAPWNNVVVAFRAGAPIRISDIGEAVDGPENAKQAAWVNGKRGVFLIIYKQPAANVVETVDRIKAAFPRLRAALPPAITLSILSDRTQTIRASVEDVQLTLLLTIVLVVTVIFVFLRNFWATVIPGVTVPLTLTGTCGLMYLVGYSLDNLSLMALTIAVGFVVDDAIVMLENIVRHLEEGMSAREAAFKGSGEIGFTIVSISISLVAVFIPLLLMSGIVGRLFREFSVTVTMMIALSAFVSLTLTPMMASRFLRDEKHARHGRFYNLSERMFERLIGGYARGLDFVLRHQRLTLTVFFATVGLAVYLFIIIPKGFFPQQDVGMISGTAEAAQDVSFAEMKKKEEQLAAIVAEDPAVDTIGMFVGAGSNALTTNNGRMFITLKPHNERDASANEVISRLRPKLAQVQGAALFLQASQDINIGARGARTQFQYTLQDADLDELNAWGPKMLAKLQTLPQLRDVASDQQTNGNTLRLEVDRDQAARYGIQPQAIDDILYDAFGQRQAAQYFTQLNSYHVILEVTPSMQGDPDTLRLLYVKASSGQLVPLSAFAHWSTDKVAPLSVNHQGQFPAITLSFNLASGISLGQATEAIQQAEAQMGKPDSLLGTFQGNAQAFQASIATVPYLIAAALVVVYIILGILYESYIHPLTILSTLPSAGVGALLILLAFGFDFSLIALIGVILLIGLVKKNGIMMVDFALDAERREGLEPEEAIRRACLLRFRPIMMTTMAAMFGGIPLMLGTGSGAEIRQPLGYAMVGGLIVSQALTLFTTPVVYLYLDRLSNWLSGKRHAEPLAEPEDLPADVRPQAAE